MGKYLEEMQKKKTFSGCRGPLTKSCQNHRYEPQLNRGLSHYAQIYPRLEERLDVQVNAGTESGITQNYTQSRLLENNYGTFFRLDQCFTLLTTAQVLYVSASVAPILMTRIFDDELRYRRGMY